MSTEYKLFKSVTAEGKFVLKKVGSSWVWAYFHIKGIWYTPTDKIEYSADRINEIFLGYEGQDLTEAELFNEML